MKISGVDIRPGNIIEYEGGIWKVAKIQHTQPGKGGAYMQVEMKNVIVEHLKKQGHDVIDCGAHEYDAVDDYPAFCIAART